MTSLPHCSACGALIYARGHAIFGAAVQPFTHWCDCPSGAPTEATTNQEPTMSTPDPMRKEPRELTDIDKRCILAIKDAGNGFHDMLAALGSSREISLAKTKAEEAVMWAVKHITG